MIPALPAGPDVVNGPSAEGNLTIATSRAVAARHAVWVRLAHWIGAAAFLTLAFSGVVVLMAHPRLYWGETGNDLTPAWVELPIGRNYQHGGYVDRTAFFPDQPSSPVSATLTYGIFNENGWARSLHFLAAWFLVGTGALYLVLGLVTRHFGRHLLPRRAELAPRRLGEDLRDHLRLRIPPASGGPRYGPLQKCAYFGVVFLALPLAVVTGLAMSPAIVAAHPWITGIFGGAQSARTIHFLAFAALTLFLLAHFAMVGLSGFRRQMRAMTWGNRR